MPLINVVTPDGHSNIESYDLLQALSPPLEDTKQASTDSALNALVAKLEGEKQVIESQIVDLEKDKVDMSNEIRFLLKQVMDL